MKILIAGAGPAGLYLAYLLARSRPDWRIRVVEQNARDSTFGFGVVFSDRALEFLRADDRDTFDLITPRMQGWTDLTVVHRGERVVIDGIGFAAIGRLRLLQLLNEQLSRVSLSVEFEKALRDKSELETCDLVVAADGANSFVRGTADFGTTIEPLTNKFAWFGTSKLFPTLTQTFVQIDLGTFNAHHYRYRPGMSTFIVECDRATWLRGGFDRLDPEAARAVCERVFAETLDGSPLISNKSAWRSFPWVWNERWSHRNMVLVGDALHTAHFSIGSGTRLALEDAIALAKALEEEPRDLRAGLARYEAARRPTVEKLVRASRTSADWYERFPAHMRLAPLDFAHSYLTRSGRIDDDRLRATSPRFMARYDAHRRALSFPPPLAGEG